MEKLSNDPEAAAKMSAIRDPEEAYRLASSMQDGFTKEEFISAMEAIRKTSGAGAELSDEDLMKVAGGIEPVEILTYAVSGALPIITAASAASI